MRNNGDGVGHECRRIRFTSGSAMTAGNKRHKPAVGPRRAQKRAKGRENTEEPGQTLSAPARRRRGNRSGGTGATAGSVEGDKPFKIKQELKVNEDLDESHLLRFRPAWTGSVRVCFCVTRKRRERG